MPYLTDRADIINAIEKNPEKVKRLWIEEGFRVQYDRFIKRAKENGISIRIIPKETFSKRFKNAKAHICAERDSYAYFDPHAFLNYLKTSKKKVFICAF
ncbi:MAG TPA: RNA methyltransferase substrate-binding domain-containing protein, partial [Syntrophorhabdaceae bacterium]|nr:RNA methyltransferase substrate-binding domain-containing protein [Syntrophorhabdaceae bacterium]